MKSSGFSTKKEIINDINVIYINGYLDAHTAPILEEILKNIVDSKNYKIIINFKDLDYISSAGLGVFMGYIEECRENSGDIKMCELPKNVFTIFELLGFPLLFDIDENITDSISKFEKMDSNVN